METTYCTQAGLDAMKEQLFAMEAKDLPKATSALGDARALGDLKENFEYQAAKKHLAFLQDRMNQLRDKISNITIIDESKIDTSKACILTKVTLKNKKSQREVIYQLVSPHEADFKAGKISVKSPVGQAILGKKIGEIATVQAPVGIIEFEVINITI